jgi:hypothetical protein
MNVRILSGKHPLHKAVLSIGIETAEDIFADRRRRRRGAVA